MSDELRILLMGYIDDELDATGRARVEAALQDDKELRRELAEMRRLQSWTDAAAADDAPDAEIERFWNEIYNRLERHTAWILLLVGFTGMVAAAAYLFFTDPETHAGIKLAAACAGVGGLLLVGSVARERARLLPHDRYSKDVHR